MSFSNGYSGTPPTAPQLAWLRRLLDDVGNTELEQATASGSQIEFFLRSPPITGSPIVTVNAVTRTLGIDYVISPTLDSVIFTAPPATGLPVVVRYTRQTWSDAELNSYLLDAGARYNQDRHIVYTAGAYALDTLISGAASAFDFGEGQENFQFGSVQDRMERLRDNWIQRVEDDAENGVLIIQDFEFDSLSAGDYDDDPASFLAGSGGWFPESPGALGGLN